MSDDKTLGYFDLDLPIYKKGDDLAHCLSAADGNPAEAFRKLADTYRECEAMCRRMAGFFKENEEAAKEIYVDADCHMIQLEAPKDSVANLIRDGLLVEYQYVDEDPDDAEIYSQADEEYVRWCSENAEADDDSICTDYDGSHCRGVVIEGLSPEYTGGWNSGK